MALSLSHLTNKWYVVLLLLYVVVVGSKKVCFWYVSAKLFNSKVSSRLGDACLVFFTRRGGGGVGELIASNPYRTGLYKLLQVYSLTHSIDRLINQSNTHSQAMAPGLGLAHTDPTSYHESKKKSLHQNGDDASATQQKSTQVPAVPVLQNDCEVEDVVEALKV